MVSTQNKGDFEIMLDLTEKDINSLITSMPLVVINCWAPWCQFCVYYTPLLEDIARNHIEKIAFAKINLEANGEFAKRFKIIGIPTLLVFKNGKLVETIVGVTPTRKLEPMLLKWIEEKENGKK